MKFNIDIGHPEVLLLCGSYLMTANNFGFGVALLSLGLIGGIFRAGFRIQKTQQEIENKAKLFKEMDTAGEELGTAIATFLGSFSGGGKKNRGGPVH